MRENVIFSNLVYVNVSSVYLIYRYSISRDITALNIHQPKKIISLFVYLGVDLIQRHAVSAYTIHHSVWMYSDS